MKITEEVFRQIKEDLSKYRGKDVSKAYGISEPTISVIKHSKSFDAYRVKANTHFQKLKAQKKTTDKQVVVRHWSPMELIAIKAQLDTINSRLSILIDHLTGGQTSTPPAETMTGLEKGDQEPV